MKAYIRYGANDIIISGVLVKSNKRPTGVGWVEVPLKYCCGTFLTVTPGKNRAFIKYTKSGQVVGSSTIVRKTKPSGNWVEVPYNRCCNAGVPTIPFTVEFNIVPETGVTITDIFFLNTPPLTSTPIPGEGTHVFQIPTDTTVVSIQYEGENTSGEDLVITFYDSDDNVLNSQTVGAGAFGPLGIGPVLSTLPSNYMRLVIDTVTTP